MRGPFRLVCDQSDVTRIFGRTHERIPQSGRQSGVSELPDRASRALNKVSVVCVSLQLLLFFVSVCQLLVKSDSSATQKLPSFEKSIAPTKMPPKCLVDIHPMVVNSTKGFQMNSSCVCFLTLPFWVLSSLNKGWKTQSYFSILFHAFLFECQKGHIGLGISLEPFWEA